MWNNMLHLICLGQYIWVNMSSVYLQDPENPILARQDRNEASQVLWGQTCDVIDFVSR